MTKKKQEKTLQIITIIAIIIVAGLFFTQRIILAMIIGAVFLGAQKAYLHKQKKK